MMLTTRTAESASDQVFAAIDRLSVAVKPYRAAIEQDDVPDEVIDPLHDAVMGELGRVYRTTPTTPAGLLAMMEVMEEWDGDHLRLTRPDDASDDAHRGLARVFHHARRLLAAASEPALPMPADGSTSALTYRAPR